MNKNEVFLSYASEDEKKVRLICEILKERGFEVFFAPDVLPRVDYEEELEERIKNAYAVLIVWSSSSVEKAKNRDGWIYREAKTAFEEGELFQILIETEITRPEPFGNKPAIDMSDWVNDPTNNDKFDRALTHLQPFWESINGLLKDITVMRPLRLIKAPNPD